MEKKISLMVWFISCRAPRFTPGGWCVKGAANVLESGGGRQCSPSAGAAIH